MTSQGDGVENSKKPVRVKGAPNAYWVRAEFTPFYRMGPQQPNGPDQSLKKETRLTVVRRGFGYSEVTLDDGSTGWVGTDDIGPVPAEIIEQEQRLLAGGGSGPGSSKRPKSRAIVEFYDESNIPDMPPPDDLILPDSTATPVIKPEFRY